MTPPIRIDRFSWEKALRADPEVTGGRMLTLLTLATYMDSDGSNARPGAPRLAAETGQGERTVRRHLEVSTGQGWLQRTHRGHRRGDGTAVASEYAATVPASIGHSRVMPASDRPTGRASTGHLSGRLSATERVDNSPSTGHPAGRLRALTGRSGASQPATQPAISAASTGHSLAAHQTNPPGNQAAAEIDESVRRVMAAAGLPSSVRSHVARALTLACTETEILTALGVPLTGDVRNPVAVQIARLRELRPAEKAQASAPKPDWCRDCDHPHTRLVEREDGRWEPARAATRGASPGQHEGSTPSRTPRSRPCRHWRLHERLDVGRPPLEVRGAQPHQQDTCPEGARRPHRRHPPYRHLQRPNCRQYRRGSNEDDRE